MAYANLVSLVLKFSITFLQPYAICQNYHKDSLLCIHVL